MLNLTCAQFMEMIQVGPGVEHLRNELPISIDGTIIFTSAELDQFISNLPQ